MLLLSGHCCLSKVFPQEWWWFREKNGLKFFFLIFKKIFKRSLHFFWIKIFFFQKQIFFWKTNFFDSFSKKCEKLSISFSNLMWKTDRGSQRALRGPCRREETNTNCTQNCLCTPSLRCGSCFPLLTAPRRLRLQ